MNYSSVLFLPYEGGAPFGAVFSLRDATSDMTVASRALITISPRDTDTDMDVTFHVAARLGDAAWAEIADNFGLASAATMQRIRRQHLDVVLDLAEAAYDFLVRRGDVPW